MAASSASAPTPSIRPRCWRTASQPIDLLVVNLYPFEATVAAGRPYDDCIENIDIGGPAMIRAAAKNHGDVAVVVDGADYAAVLDDLAPYDGARHAAPCAAASRRRPMPAPPPTTRRSPTGSPSELGDATPPFRALGGAHRRGAALRREPAPDAPPSTARPRQRPGVATARQVQGKQLSYNNINDTDAAYEAVAEFDPTRSAAVVIVKHANPCGVAEGATLREAYEKALRCDPVSAFGGIVALNRTARCGSAPRPSSRSSPR